ncbi:MAG: GTP 3',8-cyclase MoaA [Clostridia bacterium]|nr:GTP 3',8-cyclase MoaA [Clostridia bacterium]
MKDNFGREIKYLRLSVTELCNLRCRYCMPEDGVCKKSHADMLTAEEMVTAVRAAASLGIKKIRITGGEPLVKRNVVSLCSSIAKVEGIEEVCITTNATLLKDLALPLREAGVSRVNLSMDTLNEEKYRYITRRGRLEDALEGMEAALSAGFDKVKLNVVLIGGFNDDEIPTIAELSRRYPMDVRFIELMPMHDGGEFGQAAYIPCAKVLEYLPDAEKLGQEGVAEMYRLSGALGRIGLISPVSAHFCGTCDRLRLTADGKLKPCLHSAVEYPIKGMTQEQMAAEMKRAILSKPPCHDELSATRRSNAGRNMNRIGG